MIGVIIGDIVGSRFEYNNIKSKDFELFTDECHYTDDTVMSLAVCKALMLSEPYYENLSQMAIKCMQEIGNTYPRCDYGDSFYNWLKSRNPQPYNSYGNGAAMRVCGCADVVNLGAAKILSQRVTEITHNHPEAIKGAEAVVIAKKMAYEYSINEIKEHINQNYYPMNFKLSDIRDNYTYDISCQGTVPYALQAFFESESFEDAIRNAVSIGGDTDTICAITGGIAEAYYGVPDELRMKALSYLDDTLIKILTDFENYLFESPNPRELILWDKNKNVSIWLELDFIINETYITYYNHECWHQATKCARISIKEPTYINTKCVEPKWILTPDEKQELVEILNNKHSKTLSNWENLLIRYNWVVHNYVEYPYNKATEEYKAIYNRNIKKGCFRLDYHMPDYIKLP